MLLLSHRAQESLTYQQVLSQDVLVCVHMCVCVHMRAHLCASMYVLEMEPTASLTHAKHIHATEPYPVPSPTHIQDQPGRQGTKGCGAQTLTSTLDVHT